MTLLHQSCLRIRILSHIISSHRSHPVLSIAAFPVLSSRALSYLSHRLGPSFNPLSSSGFTSQCPGDNVSDIILRPAAPSSYFLSPISLEYHSPNLRAGSHVEMISLKKRGTYRCSPVHNCLKFSDVLKSSAPSQIQSNNM